MHIYFADSQIPELRDLPAAVRRVVVRRALGILRSQARLFYWLPTLLCVVGGVCGSLLGVALLSYFRQAPTAINGDWIFQSIMSSYSGVGIGACTAGFIGLQLQRWKFRPFLGGIIENYFCEISRTA